MAAECKCSTVIEGSDGKKKKVYHRIHEHQIWGGQPHMHDEEESGRPRTCSKLHVICMWMGCPCRV